MEFASKPNQASVYDHLNPKCKMVAACACCVLCKRGFRVVSAQWMVSHALVTSLRFVCTCVCVCVSYWTLSSAGTPTDVVLHKSHKLQYFMLLLCYVWTHRVPVCVCARACTHRIFSKCTSLSSAPHFTLLYPLFPSYSSPHSTHCVLGWSSRSCKGDPQ